VHLDGVHRKAGALKFPSVDFDFSSFWLGPPDGTLGSKAGSVGQARFQRIAHPRGKMALVVAARKVGLPPIHGPGPRQDWAGKIVLGVHIFIAARHAYWYHFI
jgi:hypothetical protein